MFRIHVICLHRIDISRQQRFINLDTAPSAVRLLNFVKTTEFNNDR